MAGRPAKYETAEEMQDAIDSYFSGQDKDTPTITGLALHLGFESRQSFYDYENNEVFSYTVKKARLRIESKYEGKLYSQACTGAIFALKNFGWKDKTETEISGKLGLTLIESETDPQDEPIAD